ncbi:hypothetical protein F4553_002373 [Allocatelliglobosispora scoriae]|uniref:Peptidase inhibitor family I36 n=1 Tax=Allocatelliglobosispora scoriae TaxID=643052 RepID=A0A841BL30_9ACTN|nr:peptidase inhibitor family I36 protein [Allocatelliglobosispora scoriae]MBB5868994.1 hypothetical protein [Allocatelliglobosispora scoriae]
MHLGARIVTIVVAAVTTLAVIAPAAAVAARPDEGADMQELVDAYLRDKPGGVQIGPGRISYENGAIVVTVARSSLDVSGPNCPSGLFCIYDGTNFRYPRTELSTCVWRDLYPYWNDVAGSVHYNKSAGAVTFINHGKTPHLGDTPLFAVGVSKRTISDLGDNADIADHVQPYC